jgi:hypothetical protein
MDGQPGGKRDRRPIPDRPPERPVPRRAGSISRYIGTRLVVWGRMVAVIGVVVLVAVAAKSLLAYTRHELGSTIATAVAGGAIGIALISVGESMTKSGGGYLRGEKHLARSIGRRMGRRRSRRSGGPRS